MKHDAVRSPVRVNAIERKRSKKCDGSGAKNKTQLTRRRRVNNVQDDVEFSWSAINDSGAVKF